jgi:aquaporin Z
MKNPTQAFLAEFIGTGALIGVGLSCVILMFAKSSPVVSIIPDFGLRRLITGFLFGSTGGLIAVSRVGRLSGAHINPAVTLGFWILNKLDSRHALGYIVAQCAGGVVGAVPLLLWGAMGVSVDYGATAPGPGYGVVLAMVGEIVTTFALVIGLLVFIGHKRLKAFTPLLFPFLYAIMVYLEAPVSGTSTNPARSLGPAVISGVWHGWWIYFAGPAIGAWIAVMIHKHSFLKRLEVDVAKVYHYSLDPLKIFTRRKSR